MPDLPFIDISGAPLERGRQYGEAARERIVLGVRHYAEQLARNGLDRAGLADLARGFLPRIDAFDPDFTAEMRGIAQGAGVDLGDIVLLNARTEILQLAERQARTKLLPEDEADGCTGLFLLPGATADGRLIHAQNWDWKAECAETSAVVRIAPHGDEPEILTFVEAGQLARSGMNAAGIAITANYLESDRDYRQPGVPLALIRRKVLKQKYLSRALRVVYVTPKSASNNMMVSHCGGFGVDIECAPDESFLLYPEEGLLVHANHWRSPVALSKLRDTGIAATPDSIYRDQRVEGLVRPSLGQATVDTVKAALADGFQSPYSVCRPPRPGDGGNLSATVATVVMVPESGTLEVALLPALGADYRRFSFVGAVEPQA